MRRYPVDPNKLWALVNSVTGEVVKRAQKWPRLDGEHVKLLDNLVLFEEVYSTVPIHNKVTHKAEPAPPVVDFEKETVTYGWAILPRDPKDLGNKEELELLKASYNELVGHVGSVGERLARLENMVSRLWREHYESED